MLDPEQGIFRRSIRQIYHAEFLAKQGSAYANPRKPTQNPIRTLSGDWTVAAKRYRWIERKDAFDKYYQEQEDALWDERMKNLREKRWTVSEDFFKKVYTMLEMPLVKRTVATDPNGRAVTIIEPINWTARDVVAYAKLASDMGGAAIGDANWAATLLEQKGFDVNMLLAETGISNISEEDFEV